MTDVLNLEINARSNAEPTNIRIAQISSSAEYRMDERFQNLSIFRILIKFPKLKKFWKFVNFPHCKILEIC